MSTEEGFEMVSRAKKYLLFRQSMSDAGDSDARNLLEGIQELFLDELRGRESVETWVMAQGTA